MPPVDMGERGIESVLGGERPIRVLVAKPGLDSHDRGAKVIARALRDAGMEVIYSGLHRTPEEVVEAVIQEDVDVLAISLLSGAHGTLIPRIMEGLRAEGVEGVLVLAGGIIPDEDVPVLKACGVAEVFGPGSDTDAIVQFIRERAGGKHRAGDN